MRNAGEITRSSSFGRGANDFPACPATPHSGRWPPAFFPASASPDFVRSSTAVAIGCNEDEFRSSKPTANERKPEEKANLDELRSLQGPKNKGKLVVPAPDATLGTDGIVAVYRSGAWTVSVLCSHWRTMSYHCGASKAETLLPRLGGRVPVHDGYCKTLLARTAA